MERCSQKKATHTHCSEAFLACYEAAAPDIRIVSLPVSVVFLLGSLSHDPLMDACRSSNSRLARLAPSCMFRAIVNLFEGAHEEEAQAADLMRGAAPALH